MVMNEWEKEDCPFFSKGAETERCFFFLTKLDSGSSRGLEIKSQQRGFGVNLKKNISD